MPIRIGDVLIERGILTTEQVNQVLAAQKDTGVPFGVICEKVFGVSAEDVEEAWAAQYVSITRKIDPRTELYDEGVRDILSRRQAWQFRILPIRYEGEELMMATTARHLRRALRFATRFIGEPIYFVIAEPTPMGEMLCKRYPLGGMTPQSIDDDSLDRLLVMAKSAAA